MAIITCYAKITKRSAPVPENHLQSSSHFEKALSDFPSSSLAEEAYHCLFETYIAISLAKFTARFTFSRLRSLSDFLTSPATTIYKLTI